VGDLGSLERRLERLAAFEQPRLELEQYPTPAPLAARILHTARLQGDLEGRTVLDLGAGTGVLAIGAALTGAEHVVAIEVDPRALRTARRNERVATSAEEVGADDRTPAETTARLEWITADATRPPLPASDGPTVVTNPPFGAQDGQEGADRAFLAAASRVAGVSYSIHNTGSLDFLEAFAEDHDGRVTHAFEAELVLERTFDFHEAAREAITVVVVRIDWAAVDAVARGRSD
jgi:putative methylase